MKKRLPVFQRIEISASYNEAKLEAVARSTVVLKWNCDDLSFKGKMGNSLLRSESGPLFQQDTMLRNSHARHWIYLGIVITSSVRSWKPFRYSTLMFQRI
jgi:hypothetical protein